MTLNKKLALLVFTIAFSLTPAARAENETAKRNDIKKLFEMQNIKAMSTQVTAQIIASLAQSVPASQRQAVEKAVNQEANYEDLLESLVPVYARNFSHAEIKAILAFYKTPAGSKFIKTQPKIMQESAGIVQAWASHYLAKVQERLGKSAKAKAPATTTE